MPQTLVKSNYLAKNDLIVIFENLTKTYPKDEIVDIYSKIIKLDKTITLPYNFVLAGLNYTLYKNTSGIPMLDQVIPKFSKEELRIIRQGLKNVGKYDFFQIKEICRKILNLFSNPASETKKEIYNLMPSILYYAKEAKEEPSSISVIMRKLIYLTGN